MSSDRGVSQQVHTLLLVTLRRANVLARLSLNTHVSPHIPKPLWRKADKAALPLKARELDLLPRSYENLEDIDAGVYRLVRWIKEAVIQPMPLLKPVFFSISWLSSELIQLVRNARRTRRWHTRCPCAEAWRVYLEALNAKRGGYQES